MFLCAGSEKADNLPVFISGSQIDLQKSGIFSPNSCIFVFYYFFLRLSQAALMNKT